MTIYTFKPMTPKDLTLLFQWINCPHVKRWWGDDGSWYEFRKRYLANIASDLVFPHIVFYEHRALGYINYWFVEEDDDFYPMYKPSTVGTDQFIGESDLLGHGHGTAFVRQFTDELLRQPNIDLVITDPDPENKAAIRCYEKAGFERKFVHETKDGAVLIMEKCCLG